MNNSTFLNMIDITNPESVEKYFNDVANNVLYAQEQEVLENDYVSLAHKKLINASLTADAKRAFIKGRTLQKTLNMDGFEEQEVEIVDKDSGFILQRDESGNIVSRTPIRLQAYGHYDGVDELENVKKSAYKQANQPKFVSMLTGKPEHELTEYDYANVKAYETVEAYNAMTYTGEGMYQSARYNPSVDYTANQTPKSARVMVRLSGDDRYGRRLAEVVNPTNGRDIGFEFANDPYTNASFDLYKSLDTKANRAGVEAKYKRYDVQAISKTIADKYDTDGRFFENLDMIQASFYRMWARVAQRGPKAIMDTEYWAKVADEATGQEIADAWAGVKTSTRRAVANEMTKGLDQWKNGNYIDSIITFGSQLDRLFAESAAQTITGVVAGAATGGIGLAAGASMATASVIAMVSGGTASAIDNTLISMEDYEANNGKAMSGVDVAKTFAGYLALAVPEMLFGALGIGKLLPKAVTSSMNSVYKQGAKLSAGKHLVGGFLGEAAQEMGEESFGTYMSQDEKNAQSFGDIFTSPETAVAGVAGGLMGGALAGLPAAKGFVFDARKESKQDKEREKIVEQQATKTVTGTTLNEVQETEAQATISRILNTAPTADTYASGKSVDGNEIKKYVQDLDKVIISNASEKTVAQATKVKSALVKRYVENLKTEEERVSFLSDLGMTPAEALAEQASSENARAEYIDTGKRLTNEAVDELYKKHEAFGKLLGMTDDEIKRTLREVIVEARDSWKGYKTYSARIDRDLAVISNPFGVSEEEKEQAYTQLEHNVAQVARFLANQKDKLTRLTDAVYRLAHTDTLGSVSVKYPSNTGSFVVKASDLINKGRNSGVAKTFEAAITEAKELAKIVNNLPNDIKEKYSLQEFSSFTEAYFNKASQDFYASVDSAVSQSYDATKRVDAEESNETINARTAIHSLQTIVKGKINDKKLADLKLRLASVTDETYAEIERILSDNKSIKPETKDKLLSTLKEIRSSIQTSVQSTATNTVTQNKAIGKANTTINKYADVEKITSSTAIGLAKKELLAAQAELLKVPSAPKVLETLGKIKETLRKLEERKAELNPTKADTNANSNANDIIQKAGKLDSKSSLADINGVIKEVQETLEQLRKSTKEEDKKVVKQLADLLNKKLIGLQTNVRNKTTKQTTQSNTSNLKELRKFVATNKDKVQTKTIDGVEIKYYVVPDSLMNGDFGMALDWQTVLISEFTTKSPENKRTAYLDAFNRAEKHGINMHELAQNTDADTFTDLVLLHEYRHTQQRKLFDNVNEGAGRWELDSELYALLHTGLITQEQYNTIYNAELKPYVKERVQKQTAKPENQTQSAKSGLADLKVKYQQGLTKAGLTKEQADAVVTLLEANARVMSRLSGVSVEEYLNTRFAGYQSMTQKEFEEAFEDALYQAAYNGSVADFDQFSLDFIGLGEGRQVHGWGLYFAARKEISDFNYRQRLLALKNQRAKVTAVTSKGTPVFLGQPEVRALVNTPKAELHKQLKEYVEYELGNLKKDAEALEKVVELLNNKNLTYVDVFKLSLDKTSQYYNAAHEIRSNFEHLEDLIPFEELTEEEITEAFKSDDFKLDIRLKMSYLAQLTTVNAELKHLASIDLSDVTISVEGDRGQLFKVDIPENDVLMNEQLRFSEQSDKVQKILATMPQLQNVIDKIKSSDMAGKYIYLQVVKYYHDQGVDKKAAFKEASLALNAAGIKGIKYYGVTDKECFVVFDDKAVKILEKYYQKKGKTAKGAITFDNEKALISVFEQGDVSTALHETAHFFCSELRKATKIKGVTTWVTDAWKTMQEQYGFTGTLEDVKDSAEWVRVQERFARDFEAYMREGKAPKPELQSIFDACKQWLKAIYRNITQILGKTNRLSPEMAKVFDSLLTNTDVTAESKSTEPNLESQSDTAEETLHLTENGYVTDRDEDTYDAPPPSDESPVEASTSTYELDDAPPPDMSFDAPPPDAYELNDAPPPDDMYEPSGNDQDDYEPSGVDYEELDAADIRELEETSTYEPWFTAETTQVTRDELNSKYHLSVNDTLGKDFADASKNKMLQYPRVINQDVRNANPRSPIDPIGLSVEPLKESRRVSNIMEKGVEDLAYLESCAQTAQALFVDYFTNYSSKSYEDRQQAFEEKTRMYKSFCNYLLYGTIEHDNKTFIGGSLQANAVMAIDLACREFLSTMNVQQTLNPKDTDGVARAFGQDSDKLKYKVKQVMRKLVAKHGVPRRSKAIRLGRMIAAHMGIQERRYNSNNPELKARFGTWDAIIAGLGELGLHYMEAKGWVEFDKLVTKGINAAAGEKLFTANEITTVKIKDVKAINSAITTFLGEFETVLDDTGKPVLKRDGTPKLRRNGKGLKSKYFITSDTIEGPKTKPVPRLEKGDPMYIDGTNRMMIVPDFQQAQINKTQETPHTINLELVKLIHDNIDTVRTNLGYASDSDLKAMYYDAADAAEGVNASIDAQITSLLEFADIQDATNCDWYFKAFVSKNGRIFYDSPTLNPQSGKSLTRFLCLPKEFYQTFEIGNAQHAKYEAYAISQAFDCLGKPEFTKQLAEAFNKLSLVQLSELKTSFVELPHNEFFEKLNEYLTEVSGVDFNLEDVENYSQCLLVLQHLEKKREHIDSKSKTEFKTWLAVEIDSTTSGYALRTLQFPVPEVVDEFGEKLGFVEKGKNSPYENMPIDQMKKQPGFYDIYKTLAKKMLENMQQLLATKTPEEFFKPKPNQYPTGFEKDFVKVFRLLAKALPQVELDADGNIVISSALRNLMKPVVMVYGYNGGEASILRNMSDTIMEDLFDIFYRVQNAGSKEAFIKQYNITDKKELAKLDAIIEAMTYVSSKLEVAETFSEDGKPSTFYSKNLEGLYKAMGVKSIADIKLKTTIADNTKIIAIDEFFNTMLNPVYGDSAWSALEASFAKQSVFNNLLAATAGSMYSVFDKVWQPVQQALLSVPGLPQSSYTACLEALSELWPSVPLIYSQITELDKQDPKAAKDLKYARERKSILMANFENDSELLGNVSVMLPELGKDGQPVFNTRGIPSMRSQAISLVPDVKVMSGPKLGAPVGSIHYLDGILLAMTLNQQYGIPVHDAFVLAFNMIDSTAKIYNNAMWDVGREYNLFGTMVDRLKEVMQVYEDIRTGKNDVIETVEKVLKEVNPNFKVQLPKQIVGTLPALDGFGNQAILDKNIKALLPATTFEALLGAHSDGKFARTGKIKVNSIQDLIAWLDVLRDLNDKFRDEFYNRQFTNANMACVSEEGIGDSTARDLEEILKVTENSQNSGPNGFTDTQTAQVLLDRANTDVDARLEIVDKLQELAATLGDKTESAEYIAHVKDLLKRLNPAQIKDYTVKVLQDHAFTAGTVHHDTKEILIGFDDKKGSDLDAITGLSIRSMQSGVEVYAHETIHAASRYALVVLKSTKAYKKIQQLLNLQKAAMNVVTWEDFMPETYDPNLKAVYENQAQRAWDYIFNNPETAELAGLSEFMSFGLSNPKVMAKLGKNYVVEKKVSKSLLDRLVSFFKNMVGIITGEAKVGDVAESFMDLLKGNRAPFKHNKTILEELDRLVVSISYADTKAVDRLVIHPANLVDNLYKALRTLTEKGNKVLVPTLNYITNYLDDHNMVYVRKIKNMSKLGATGKLITLLAGYAFSASRRKATREVLAAFSAASQQGAIASFYRDITTPDADSGTLELYGLLSRQIDANSKGIESTVRQDIMEGFKRTLRGEELESLTRIALFTDLQCLTATRDIQQIKHLLNDSGALRDEIKAVENRLKALDETDYMWLRNQAFGLARFMVTGVGNECQNLNAANIAAKLLMDNKPHVFNKDVETAVDELATLYALMFSDKDAKAITANLSDKGLSTFLNIHNTFVNESKYGVTRTGDATATVEQIHTIKGYTKQLLNDSYDTKIDLVSNEAAMNNAGYILVSRIADNGITLQSGLALYRRTLASPKRREGATYVLRGAHAIGTTLKDSAFSIGGAKTADELAATVTSYKQTVKTASARLDEAMKTKELTLDDFSKFSYGYTPILSPLDGTAVDYRITMSTDKKVKYLGLNLDGVKILSKMFATQNTKVEAQIRNNALTEFLYKYMNENMLENNKTIDEHKFVVLSEFSDNKFVKDVWKVMPAELRYKASKDPLYVREDWLQQIFGEPNMSMLDVAEKFTKNKRPTWWKRGIVILEAILRAVTYASKRATILFTPNVLVNNEISNINYSVMKHNVSFAKVAHMHLQNAQATRDYLDTKKELNHIIWKERTGTATKSQINKKNWLKSKLENNRVHPLMQKGMYQAIVEDIKLEDLEATGKLQKFIANLPLLKKVPKSLRSLLRVLYLGEGTFISNLMTQATQYSDFAARVTEYQLQMEKAPERYEYYEIAGKKYKRETEAYKKYEAGVFKNVLNAFINYDKPQSSIEQYANDTGILMYTKFGKRIQGVVTESVSTNPMGTLLFWLKQCFLVNTEDILEQNIVSKNLSALFYNPVDHLINTITPVPLQFALGMRQLDVDIIK